MGAVQPDSGYYSPNSSTNFPFDDNDDTHGSAVDCGDRPTTSAKIDEEERVQLDWQIGQSRMCQRRKRSLSDPTGMWRRLGCCKAAHLYTSCPGIDNRCKLDVAVQTDGRERHYVDRIINQSVIAANRLQLELTNERASDNRDIQLVAGRLAMLGDQFFVDWPHGIGVFAAVHVRRIFLAGVFLLVPLPPVWLQNLMRVLGRHH